MSCCTTTTAKNPVGGEVHTSLNLLTPAGPPQPSTADTDVIQLQPNVVYGVSIESERGDQTTIMKVSLGHQTSIQNEYDYVQL